MRDLRSALKGLGAKTRSRTVLLRKVPAIAEIEAMLDVRGAAWALAFEAKCDEASLALFGITQVDTCPKEPHPDDIEDKSAISRFSMSDEAFSTYSAAIDRWYDWQTVIAEFERDTSERGLISYFASIGYDVTDGRGSELRCLPYFSRQLYVAHKGLLPGAKVTLDGSGKRAAQSVEEWGAALAAEAARFRRSE